MSRIGLNYEWLLIVFDSAFTTNEHDLDLFKDRDTKVIVPCTIPKKN
jgi:hypothetical protein